MIFVRKCFCCTREVYWLGWRSKVARLHLLKSEICNTYIVQRQFSNLTVMNTLLLCTLVVSGGSRIFPRGGREPSRGGVNTPNFPENCMKSKEFGRPGGGVRPSRPPLDPPMVVLVAMEEEQTPVVTRQRNGHRIHAVILRLTGRQWFSAHLWLVQLMST